ncbi:MAG: ABC transporter permease [Candidatus Methylomirabilales bacterium]
MRWRVNALRSSVVLLGVLLIEVLVRAGTIPRVMLIAPSEMAAALWRLLGSGAMTPHILLTLRNIGIALTAAIVLGFGVGALVHALPRVRSILDPLFASYYSIPIFVFYPLFIVIFGMNSVPLIIMGFLSAVVAMIINTLNGLDRVPRALLKTARVLQMNRARTVCLIVLPAAAAHLFTGVKLAVAYAFIGVIAAEFILSGGGLGYQISFTYFAFDNPTMYALIALTLILVTAINLSLYAWEKRLLTRMGRR